MTAPLVVSLGGATFSKEEIDTEFLRRFRTIILKQARKRRIFVYVGGGVTCRKYQAALAKLGADQMTRDWIGIYVTRLNAQLLRLMFGRAAEPNVIENPTQKVRPKRSIVVAAGWLPGWSTDYDAVLLAKNVRAPLVVNLTNVDYVYDKDPAIYKHVKAFPRLGWSEYKKLIGGKWTPGLHTPFDPVAARGAAAAGLKVAIMNGANLPNFELFLAGKPFKGTIIG